MTFLDTSAIYALAYSGDPNHDTARSSMACSTASKACVSAEHAGWKSHRISRMEIAEFQA